MFNPLRFFLPSKMVGIDIGTSSIKVVEISLFGKRKTLENYGQIFTEALYKEPLVSTERGTYLLSNEFVSKAIQGILQEAKIKTRAAVISIPDYSTFCTSFDIPPMTPKEIPDAIRYNASQYITLPISEVTLDWRVTPHNPADKNSLLRVFLVAVPNQVIQEYKNVARLAGLRLHALEAEALGITRALQSINQSAAVLEQKKAVCLVDIGVQTSTINIIDNGFLKKSYSFNWNSGQLARVVSSSLGVDIAKAEEVKNREGLLHPRPDIAKTLYLLIDPLLIEVKSICAEFFQSEKKPVERIYLTGGSANLPGLKEYFSENLKKEVVVPNCFSNFLYPPILDETLKEMAPGFSAAVGVALGGLET